MVVMIKTIWSTIAHTEHTASMSSTQIAAAAAAAVLLTITTTNTSLHFNSLTNSIVFMQQHKSYFSADMENSVIYCRNRIFFVRCFVVEITESLAVLLSVS